MLIVSTTSLFHLAFSLCRSISDKENLIKTASCMLLSILACKPQDGTLCIFFTRTSHLTDSGKSGLSPIRSTYCVLFFRRAYVDCRFRE